ncbi:MAG: hypothetical protein V3V01_11440 [Acidimicrobiales bacterium]
MADKPTKRYPRRVTLDLTDEQYEWLRSAAFEARTPMSGIVRALVEMSSTKKKLAGRAIDMASSETG